MSGIGAAGAVDSAAMQAYDIERTNGREEQQEELFNFTENQNDLRNMVQTNNTAGVTDIITGLIDTLTKLIEKLKGMLTGETTETTETDETTNTNGTTETGEQPEGVFEGAHQASREELGQYGIDPRDYEGKQVYISTDPSLAIQIFDSSGVIEKCYMGAPGKDGTNSYAVFTFDYEGNPIRYQEFDGKWERMAMWNAPVLWNEVQFRRGVIDADEYWENIKKHSIPESKW